MKTILYIGNFDFPNGNAAGKRVYGNTKILSALGYNPMVIGMKMGLCESIPLFDSKIEFDGVECYNIPYPNKTIQWVNFINTFSRIKLFLETIAKEKNIVAVVSYGSLSLSVFNTMLSRWCLNHNIKYISDCVDWLSVKTGNIVFDFVKWADTLYQKSYANVKSDGVIAISSRISDYYIKKGSPTVIIPPVSTNSSLDTVIVNPRKSSAKIVKFIYAGIPFRKGILIKDGSMFKDRIDLTISLLSEMSKRGFNFIFNVYGFTLAEYLEVMPDQAMCIEQLDDKIIFHGYKPNDYVIDMLKDSDFMILLRDVKKDTMFGFPTKVSESISYGIPVITTRTSDLHRYLKDGVDSYFIDIDDKNKQLVSFESILRLTDDDLSRMKSNCVNNNFFCYNNYVDELGSFLKSINL